MMLKSIKTQKLYFIRKIDTSAPTVIRWKATYQRVGRLDILYRSYIFKQKILVTGCFNRQSLEMSFYELDRTNNTCKKVFLLIKKYLRLLAEYFISEEQLA